jgi:hypothetical protein
MVAGKTLKAGLKAGRRRTFLSLILALTMDHKDRAAIGLGLAVNKEHAHKRAAMLQTSNLNMGLNNG